LISVACTRSVCHRDFLSPEMEKKEDILRGVQFCAQFQKRSKLGLNWGFKTVWSDGLQFVK